MKGPNMTRTQAPSARRSTLLAATVATLALTAAACSSPANGPSDGAGGDDVAERAELTMTIWGGEVDKAVYEERLALAAEALPDIDVELVQISDDYDTKLQTMIAGGESPDVMMVAEGVHVLSSKGQLQDMTPVLEGAGIDPVAAFGQGSVDTYSTDGSLWAVPDRAGAMVLY